MINCNGVISADVCLEDNNRAFLYGDALFETLKVTEGKVLFLEDHYFRLMSSMRILRMEIPMNFTMEFFEIQILTLLREKELTESARVRITVYRNEGGNYLPKVNSISYLIKAEPLANKWYEVSKGEYEIELYKDFYVSKQVLSSIKSTNRLINVTGSIFAGENGYDNCLLLNESKNVVEALEGNIFMLKDNVLTTPPVSEGCLNGVMRKQILSLAKKIEDLEVLEAIVSPFDLQKADELFITNVIKGIQPIRKYRKKEFGSQLATDLVVKLNNTIQTGLI